MTKINSALTKKIHKLYFMFRVNWRDARVVESGGLENRCALMGTEGSNPSLSENLKNKESSTDGTSTDGTSDR